MATAEAHYGQGYAASVVDSQTERTVANSAAYLAAHLQPGMDLLDVGCGPATITCDLAERVAPGRVLAIDVSETVLARARAHAESRGVTNVEFRRADIAIDDVTETRFDVAHAHQVLLHLHDPANALRRMMKVVRPGGIVAARDADYAGAFWHPADERLDRWMEIYRAVSHSNGAEPDAGRRLLAWAHAAGATDVTPSASIWSYATQAERDHWGGMWAERILSSRIAEQAVEYGHATREELEGISAAWKRWQADPDGWFAIPHGEILCRVP